MLKKLTALLALILASLLLFSACAPLASPEFPEPDPEETEFELVIVSDAVTDKTPETERSNSPPETTAETKTKAPGKKTAAPKTEAAIDKNGIYTKRDDVALYIHTYGKLPENFITKKDAEALGWTGGSLEPYAPGKCIGGMRFGNYEGLLPVKKGRVWYECDIDTLGKKSRGAKRIVYSNDGLIYYTSDHYESFSILYGEE